MISAKTSRWMKWGLALVVLLIAGAAWSTQARWLPTVQARWTAFRSPAAAGKAEAAKEDEHAGHDHAAHAGHEESSSLELSEQARKNIGLRVGKVELQTFVRTITVPGIVAERPGRTNLRIAAPMTGIITKVYVVQGEAIRPGQPVFDLRLTHEDMLQVQVDFLKLVEELDVVHKEIERLRPAVAKGAIAEKNVLDRQYEQQKLQASLKSQRESLLLHGLSAEQVDEIQKSRTLRSKQTVFAPARPSADDSEDATDSLPKDSLLIAESVAAETGRFVNTGDLLLTLADYAELFVEGNAFEQDGELIANALRDGRKVSMRVESKNSTGDLVPDLEILYLSDQIDPESRTLHFYVRLPNERTRDQTRNGHRFINWRFKPGQRLQLLVPVEEWEKRIVLPADAVVQEGPENFVFQQNGKHFDRRPVHVEYRDLSSVVIAQDGSVFPGDTVALNGTQQMQMALKNKAGGAPDPHAGHNH